MLATIKPFLAMTAGDLMSRDLVLIPQEMSLQAAAHLLAQARISGAPVVDGQGRCVGVLSATDFVHVAERPGPLARTEADYWCDWQVLDLESLPRTSVGEHMTTDVVTVSPSTPIRDLAQRMLDAHIHRLIVTDALRRPIGVVTSTDIVAAVAHADHVT
jgi:CBS domain-containing protein